MIYLLALALLEIAGFASLELHYIAELRRWECCERKEGTPPQRERSFYIATAACLAVIVCFAAALH